MTIGDHLTVFAIIVGSFTLFSTIASGVAFLDRKWRRAAAPLPKPINVHDVLADLQRVTRERDLLARELQKVTGGDYRGAEGLEAAGAIVERAAAERAARFENGSMGGGAGLGFHLSTGYVSRVVEKAVLGAGESANKRPDPRPIVELPEPSTYEE